MIASERLMHVFVTLADTLVTDFDLTDFLHTVTDSCVEVLDLQGAGLMLADQRGTLRLGASTGDVEALESFELDNEEGPCIDCYAGGLAIVNVELGTESDRWPGFTREAIAAGFGAVHAFPLRLRSQVIGAVNLYGSQWRALDESELAIAQTLADIATIGLLQERIIRDKTVLTEQLQTALNSRVVIEQAKGIVVERTGLQMSAAFEAIRGHARRTRQPVLSVAVALIDGTLNTAGWNPLAPEERGTPEEGARPPGRATRGT